MLPIQHWTTPTHTPVYFVKTPELPILELRIIFDAGSARDGKHSGLSDLTHNLLSEGTVELSSDEIAERFENAGAVFSTASDQDMTVVSLRTLTIASSLQPALETLKAILNAPAFSSQEFLHQQKLLLGLLEHEEQSPHDIAENAFFAMLYPHHPYAAPIAGTIKTVRALKREQAERFYQQYYCAQNARIVMVGDLSREQASIIANEIVEILPQGKQAPKLPATQNMTRGKIKRITYVSTQTHTLMGQVGIDRHDSDYFACYVGNYILGGDPLISHLGKAVREKEGLAYDIRSTFIPLAAKGPFLISFQTQTKKANQALDTTRDTLKDFMADKPKPSELQAAKNNIVNGYNLNFDSNRAIAHNLIILAFFDLPLDYFETFPDKISAVTADEVHAAFKRLIKPEGMVTVRVG